MNEKILLLPIILPLVFAALIFAFPKRMRGLAEQIAVLATLVNLVITITLFKNNLAFSFPWLGENIEFSLRLYNFSAFIILAVAGFSFLVSLYSTTALRNKNYANHFFAYLLISLAFVNGAVLANNLLLMLFFWEGLLVTIFTIIAIGNKQAFKSATKALIIIGVTDLCMMLGIALTGNLANTLTISKINLPLTTPLTIIAFILLMIGAISKAGSMPFHSWIPDAAIDAPLPFMAILPAALEKLLGIYFLARISLDMFNLTPESIISTLLMVIGVTTILLAVMMALIQTNYKKLLSYHAISQVGYMILGIGTAIPIGIVGGLFHMINHALYKSGLFLTAGAVEEQTGTADLNKLGGIGKCMPITFICFIICAASISGIPPFNGFFSKELVYDAALERGLIFYVLALLGSFFTTASFLKLGHAVFLGKISKDNENIKEVSPSMLLPMIIIASICILFGIYNKLPLNQLIQPVLNLDKFSHHDFSGWPTNIRIVIITAVVLIAALINHLYGVKTKKSALKAADHIHHAPILSTIYDKAQNKFFDPYNIGLKAVQKLSQISSSLDKKINWLYDNLSIKTVFTLSQKIKNFHTGNYSVYLLWSLTGALLIIIFLLYTK